MGWVITIVQARAKLLMFDKMRMPETQRCCKGDCDRPCLTNRDSGITASCLPAASPQQQHHRRPKNKLSWHSDSARVTTDDKDGQGQSSAVFFRTGEL